MTGFDTNILIYSCDYSDPKRQQRALDLLSSTGDGVLLWQVGLVPDLLGCMTTGTTVDEIERNMREAIELHLSAKTVSLYPSRTPQSPPSRAGLVKTAALSRSAFKPPVKAGYGGLKPAAG